MFKLRHMIAGEHLPRRAKLSFSASMGKFTDSHSSLHLSSCGFPSLPAAIGRRSFKAANAYLENALPGQLFAQGSVAKAGGLVQRAGKRGLEPRCSGGRAQKKVGSFGGYSKACLTPVGCLHVFLFFLPGGSVIAPTWNLEVLKSNVFLSRLVPERKESHWSGPKQFVSPDRGGGFGEGPEPNELDQVAGWCFGLVW